ncbi:retroviral-like aspartic protease 1 [Plakobranchus ocellatus]|uniref:Retroviral-like aspartic protease 1 n=1 Tax=Plakobranchus ocellatus TaxID=259542 RepID=A0AAV4DQD8_9GAST|nr:retroviral-like aspartic protease 1 [Plakobranchus ocellatus]
MVCKPPFEVELSKDDGKVLALQCSFPSQEQMLEESQYSGQNPEAEQIDDQFEIQEVAIHDGEWKDTTFSVSAATMDAELFDLLMDMLDERGINDEFIGHLVDYCTAYENKQYVGFLNSLKSFADK